CKQAYDVPPTF
nr:immunoglobulin light chain junction region [Mus musculus]